MQASLPHPLPLRRPDRVVHIAPFRRAEVRCFPRRVPQAVGAVGEAHDGLAGGEVGFPVVLGFGLEDGVAGVAVVLPSVLTARDSMRGERQGSKLSG